MLYVNFCLCIMTLNVMSLDNSGGIANAKPSPIHSSCGILILPLAYHSRCQQMTLVWSDARALCCYQQACNECNSCVYYKLCAMQFIYLPIHMCILYALVGLLLQPVCSGVFNVNLCMQMPSHHICFTYHVRLLC